MERAAPARPEGVPAEEVYLLFDSSEFQLGVDAEGRPVADLAVPTLDWRTTSNLRLMFGVKSQPGHGDRVLVAEISGVTSTRTCKPPREPGVAWSDGLTIEELGSYLNVSVYFPGGDLSEFLGIFVTDDPDFEPTASMQSQDEINALFADVSGRTQIRPATVEAGSTCVIRGTYTVGRHGLAVGQNVIFLVPDNGWSPPQIRDATAEGYLTIHNTGRGTAQIEDVFRPGGDEFQDYWRIQVVIGRTEMVSGDQITVVYGDTSRNGPGTIAPVTPQVMGGSTPRHQANLLAPLTVVTDRFGIGRLTLTAARRRHSIEVTPGEISKFLVIAPSHAVVGIPHTVNAIGVDRFNNPSIPPFRGAVRVEIDGGGDVAPSRETFAGSDSGTKSITWTPVAHGTVRVSVDDTTGRTGISNPIVCLPETPTETVYWGDPHCFSKFSGGVCSPAKTLSFARDVAFLDFCAVSDSANLMSDRQWASASRESVRANMDGAFVSLLGYQWNGPPPAASGRQVGSRTILTSADSLELHRGGRKGASLIEALEKIGQSPENIVVFASHPILDASWEQHEATLETAVELYSSFGSSERRAEIDRGGLAGQGISVDEILATGSQVAFLGCSAGYDGTPGLSPEEHHVRSMHAWRPFRNGLTAVLADDLTREAMVSAIRRRKTYVTTGSRTLLEFHMNDASIGEIVEQPLTDRRNFHVRVTAESDLRRVEIIRSGETVVSQAATSTEHIMDWEDRKRKDAVDHYYLRVTSWDGGMAWTSPIWVRTPGAAPAVPQRTPAGASRPRRSIRR